jgi:hypothetical protein
MSDPAPEATEPDAEPEEHPAPQAEQTPADDPINSQIGASVHDAGAVLDGAAALPPASLDQVIAQAAGLALLNAVNAQQNAYITANATVAAVVARILGSTGPVVPVAVPSPPQPPAKTDHV